MEKVNSLSHKIDIFIPIPLPAGLALPSEVG